MLALVRLLLNPYFSINDLETLQVIFSLLGLKLNGIVLSIWVKLCKLRKTSFYTGQQKLLLSPHRDSHNLQSMYPTRVLAEGVQPDVLPV